MKFLALTFFVSASAVSLKLPADQFHDIKNGTHYTTFEDFLEEHMNPEVFPGDMRGYGATIDIPMLFNLKNYGCWCQGDQLTKGHGTFQDDFDEICYHKYRGLECLYMDSVDQGDPCDVENVQYGFETHLIVNDGAPAEIEFSCKDENQATFCSRNKCLIELRAMLEYQQFTQHHYYPNIEVFGHVGFFQNRGTFEPSKFNCEIGGPGFEKIEQECCGDYPFRNYFYHDNVHSKDCCEYEVSSIQQEWNDQTLLVGKAFNTALDVCCGTGVFSAGSC